MLLQPPLLLGKAEACWGGPRVCSCGGLQDWVWLRGSMGSYKPLLTLTLPVAQAGWEGAEVCTPMMNRTGLLALMLHQATKHDPLTTDLRSRVDSWALPNWGPMSDTWCKVDTMNFSHTHSSNPVFLRASQSFSVLLCSPFRILSLCLLKVDWSLQFPHFCPFSYPLSLFPEPGQGQRICPVLNSHWPEFCLETWD